MGEDKPGLGGYEYEGGGQEIELTELEQQKVYNLDEELGAEPDFDNLPELSPRPFQFIPPQVKIPPNQGVRKSGEIPLNSMLNGLDPHEY